MKMLIDSSVLIEFEKGTRTQLLEQLLLALTCVRGLFPAISIRLPP